MWITSSLATALTPTTVALGNFDGLHRGHCQVIEPILNLNNRSNLLSVCPSELATATEVDESKKLKLFHQELKLSSWHCQSELGNNDNEQGQKIYSTVVTFNPHPQEFFSGKPKKLLAPIAEKLALFQHIGVEQVVLLPFNQELADLTPIQFVEEILVKHLQADRVSVGWDFRFGRKRAGDAKDLQAIAANYNIGVTIVPLYTCENGERISSSIIRKALEEGDLKKSNRLLGRPYSLVGQVVQGQQLGRTLGFPTANLQLPPQKFLPRFGVYAVEVYFSRQKQPQEIFSGDRPYLGVMNVGCRPTLNGLQPTVEVHLLDWSGDLYGQTLTVNLIEFLRPEQKFASLDLLKAKIHEDCRIARSILTNQTI
ncbi:MAG: bifunctional riboflavin kinase/FAD synthetase [Okeania sp. SIO2F4]|uniref:bifunctional riboflavin kinase/FAD synthetase n=1 Tax=Okeania sp. SIO2F4 TaxID=2607790 RepID=UPI0014291BCD|nr:bifunctional riboflavin kinase/FAD synthetase [Okeania sp. SIO2F4]NES05997.1 bifunctional riboflavin kinase/FAD synthetase [Okeania sp. SIO2F4]